MKKTSLVTFCLLVLWLLLALSRLETGSEDLARRQLEQALRRTAVACYAAEGFYPPDVTYMQDHYGLQYDERRYAIGYEVFAVNLMPEITVLEVGP